MFSSHRIFLQKTKHFSSRFFKEGLNHQVHPPTRSPASYHPNNFSRWALSPQRPASSKKGARLQGSVQREKKLVFWKKKTNTFDGFFEVSLRFFGGFLEVLLKKWNQKKNTASTVFFHLQTTRRTPPRLVQHLCWNQMPPEERMHTDLGFFQRKAWWNGVKT